MKQKPRANTIGHTGIKSETLKYPGKKTKRTSSRKILLCNNTISISLQPLLDINKLHQNHFAHDKNIEEIRYLSAHELFENLKDANKVIVKGLKVVESLQELRLSGVLFPFTLLLTGPYEDLKVIKQAWIKRNLKNPKGYFIREIGIVQDLTVEIIPQSPFMSLATALFDAVADLNSKNIYPSKDTLHQYLQKYYHEIKTPDLKIIHECLGRLIKDRRLYHNGRGYFILHNENVLNEVIALKSLQEIKQREGSSLVSCETATLKEFVLDSSFNSSSPTDNDSKRFSADDRSILNNAAVINKSCIQNGSIHHNGSYLQNGSYNQNGSYLQNGGHNHNGSMDQNEQNGSICSPSIDSTSSSRNGSNDSNRKIDLNKSSSKLISSSLYKKKTETNLLTPPCKTLFEYNNENAAPKIHLDDNKHRITNHPKLLRSQSFSGYETDKSYKGVSFALFGLPNKKADNIDNNNAFKRSHSFGVGQLKRSYKKTPLAESNNHNNNRSNQEIEINNNIAFGDTPTQLGTDDILLSTHHPDMKPIELKPLDVLNHYNDLGSCLSLTTKMGFASYTASDFFPPSKTESLAEELKSAFSDQVSPSEYVLHEDQPINDHPLIINDASLIKDTSLINSFNNDNKNLDNRKANSKVNMAQVKTNSNIENNSSTLLTTDVIESHDIPLSKTAEINRLLLSPRSRKKFGGMPYESQFVDQQLDQDAVIVNITKLMKENHNENIEKVDSNSRLKNEDRKTTTETSTEPLVDSTAVRLRSRTKSNDERRKSQKQRNSVLFEEKRSTLKVFGMV